MSLSDYIMGVSLPKGFKPPFDMEPYDKSTNLQEHMDAFKSRMTLAGAFEPVKLFNSLPLRSIDKFSDLASWFLAHFITWKFKPKPISNLLGISQWQGELL